MSKPGAVTMAPLAVMEGMVYVVSKGAEVLGQVTSINPASNVPTRKVSRLGDTDKATSYSPAEHTVGMEILSSYDARDLALIMGVTPPAAGAAWAAPFGPIFLNPATAAFDLTIDAYSANTGTAGDDLIGTWTLHNFKPTQLGATITADNPVSINCSGECDGIQYAPTVDATVATPL